MSKWINKDLFDSFQKEKIEEKDTSNTGFMRSNLVWDTPEKGTTENAKVYEGRFLPPPKGTKFYMRYFYHFWKSGDTWKYVQCTKTPDNFKTFCPICSVVSKLYNGTKDDKKQGYLLKRKERNVANFFIVKDGRDDDRDDENQIGASYEELEWVMEWEGDKATLSERQIEVIEIYRKFHTQNQHKMLPIPTFKV
jgi:hypothetical protein